MASILSPFLASLADNIRARPIPWQGYQRAGLITDEQVERIKAIDKQPLAKKRELLEKESREYAQLLMKLVREMKRVDILQYTLVLLSDLAQSSEVLSEALAQEDTAALVALLDHEDEQIPLLAAQALNCIPTPLSTDAQAPFFAWFKQQAAKRDHPDLQSVGVQGLANVLRTSNVRAAFYKDKENAQQLVALLTSNGGIQLTYNVLLVFWLLSFDKEIASKLHADLELIPKLVHVLRHSIKEKISRLAVGILRNMAANKADRHTMIALDLLPLLKTLHSRGSADPEIQADLDALLTYLQDSQAEMTSLDAYKAELASGQLAWSPVHRSETFWRDHARLLLQHEGDLLKQLARILSTATDTVSQAVAAHDVGCFVKANPESRKLVERLGAKTKVMELMASKDPEVRFEALGTVQILLSKAWEK
ncbi:armadillo-type protein [Protomyces lactucae-debilis]|uniref:Armadillo-type protein n=1 Tax=Protomyces lactucae-debilis TaxID=2754530 RepID=A0A1Y2EV56_PROLT|nr:armadillo-type protein [Protomyces lactucae-debilis]ORY75458.1 armadillo-type protein [Protomyces lactucae-debilis]